MRNDIRRAKHEAGHVEIIETVVTETVEINNAYNARNNLGKWLVPVFIKRGKLELNPTTVIAPGREYKELAVNELESGCMASPVVLGDTLLLRTKTHLYRIEAPKNQGAAGGD